nr:hypothetical protein [Acetobacter persici]
MSLQDKKDKRSGAHTGSQQTSQAKPRRQIPPQTRQANRTGTPHRQTRQATPHTGAHPEPSQPHLKPLPLAATLAQRPAGRYFFSRATAPQTQG